jgi:tripartite-type tricarboxylate transporter receptor subunit TctC
MSQSVRPTRRAVVAGTVAGLAMPFVSRTAGAQQGYPTRNFKVIIPTGQGGGADVLIRAFTPSWSPMLNGRGFEFEYQAAAGGQVAYELFINRRERDGYNLLFGNVGPEMVMYVTQTPNYKFPDDYIYFCGVDIDDCGIFARKDSRFKTVQDVIAEARRRTLNVSVTRIPHPGSIGMLSLAEQTGARFNLIPYGGGNPAVTAVLNGEADIGAGGISGVPNEAGGVLRVLTVFNRTFNQLAHVNENAPLVNQALGTNLPDLYTSRAFAVHAEWAAKNPEQFQMLKDTAARVFSVPKFKEDIQRTPQPWDAVRFIDQDTIMTYAKGIVEVAERFKSVLTARR